MADSESEDERLLRVLASDTDSSSNFEGFDAEDILRNGAVMFHVPMTDFEPVNNDNLPCDVADGWKKDGNVPVVAPFVKESKLNVNMASHEPIDYFNLFFDDEILQILVDQTNVYTDQTLQGAILSPFSRMTKWRPVTLAEMKVFLDLL